MHAKEKDRDLRSYLSSLHMNDYWDPVTCALYSPRGDYCYQMNQPGSIVHAALIDNTLLPLRKILFSPAGTQLLLPGVTTEDAAGTNITFIGYQQQRLGIVEDCMTVKIPLLKVQQFLGDVNGIYSVPTLMRKTPDCERIIGEMFHGLRDLQFHPIQLSWGDHPIVHAA